VSSSSSADNTGSWSGLSKPGTRTCLRWKLKTLSAILVNWLIDRIADRVNFIEQVEAMQLRTFRDTDAVAVALFLVDRKKTHGKLPWYGSTYRQTLITEQTESFMLPRFFVDAPYHA